MIGNKLALDILIYTLSGVGQAKSNLLTSREGDEADGV